jgi:hypothetical protein
MLTKDNEVKREEITEKPEFGEPYEKIENIQSSILEKAC